MGGVINQAMGRSLLGRATGGFLRENTKQEQSSKEKARGLNQMFEKRTELSKHGTDTSHLIRYDNRLGDDYYPALRGFVPSHNPKETHQKALMESTEEYLRQ